MKAAVFGDTLRVIDEGSMRLTSWVRSEANPTLSQVDRIKVDSGFPSYETPLAGGSVLFRVHPSNANFRGQRVDSANLLIVDLSGTHPAGRFEDGEWFTSEIIIEGQVAPLHTEAPGDWWRFLGG
jgi:hypothetical protein